jgi:alkanesulfonate monooxygenase SsuD/methylene tetrahydromethanopterin reductase-like flavin-dependent oxidoreductase (luciferase family)
MRIGIVLPIGQEDGMAAPPSYREIREIALEAEAAGLDSIWVYDHLLFRVEGETTGIHECWTILAAAAEATQRVQLGTLVMCTGFRNPALLAKMAATLDEISGGRLILGIGCGWHDPEYEAFGYPSDHKVGRFEEALTVIRGLIRDNHATLGGRWVTANDATLIPPARPDLPILIAAKRPRMLELTARHADAWNLAWFGLPDERLATARADLAAACAAVGRDPATLDITVGVNVRFDDLVMVAAAAGGSAPSPAISGSIDEIAAGFAAHADLGATHLIVAAEPTTPEAVRRVAAAADRFRAQRTAAANLDRSGS